MLAYFLAILAMETFGVSGSRRLVYLTAIDRATFTWPVCPARYLFSMSCCVSAERIMANFGRLARVDGFAIAEAQFTAMIGPAPA